MSSDISVVVPIYQAEKYINRCLDSLIAQTFENYEIILIDDGSKDNSGKICDEYSSKDNRIKVVHKKNEGVSRARQDGLDLSRGKYIIYVDPDDWVEKDYLKLLYCKAISEDADMVICDFWGEYQKKSLYYSQKPSSEDSRRVLEEFFPYHNGCTWNKLVKRDLFEKYNISFPKGVCFCEDLYVNCCLLKHEIKVAYVPKALYHYDQVVNANSLVRYYDETTYEHDMRLFSLFIDLFKDTKEPTNMRKTFARNLTERAFWGGTFSSKEFAEKFGVFTKYLKNENDIKGKLYYLSAEGFYSQAYYVAIISKKIKNLCYHILN